MYRPILFFSVLLFIFFDAAAQKVTLNPTVTPTLFRYNDQITVTYDVTGTSLASLTDTWVWVWIPNKGDAKSNVNPASSNPAATNPAKCTKSISNGKTLFTITFKPSDLFTSDISAQTQLGILLKGNDWSNGQTSDYLATFWDGTFQTKLISPTTQPLFVSNGDSIIVQAATPISADFTLFLNNKLINTQTSLTSYKYKLTVNDSVKSYTVKVTGTASGNSNSVTFTYNIHQLSPLQVRPPGIVDGINYNPSDPTKAILCFWAPNKTSVYTLGDFTDWNIDPKYLMKKDGERFWIELTGLTASTEYAFQYLVNDSLRIADPYTDKILEPDDNKIPATTYPNLKTIPSKALSADWYFNHFSVLQTAQTPYQWQTVNYQKPAKEKLVIYELLIRDFFDKDNRSFQKLIDTVSYFKKLGVNAIELMPVAEFNGEIGWGYNPTSMFAVQKYYGHKNKLKEFVDKCHAQGIAVIMDLVMNHQDIPNAYAMLNFDFINFHPKSSNKWFNVSAPHPYSVFFDLNHESKYTQKYLDTINYYWIHEFKIDGYRYDLSKGFTQTVSNESTAGNYDQSRINILTRMADKLWLNFPDAYVILEHFATNSEETVLANYRINEGKGMMLWANFNYAYNQNTMGYVSGSDISWMDYNKRGWTAPRAVGYMESHDEERLMYKNLQFGNVAGTYSVKNPATALQRMKPAALMFYTIPGPKMLWEFGEFGYDQSINTCESGSVDNSGNCRLDPKPVPWNTYLQNQDRKDLRTYVADLIQLRKNYDLFSTKGVAQMISGSSLVQQIILKNSPYSATPSDSSQMNAVAVANFDVTQQSFILSFPHDGAWNDYYNHNLPVNISSSSLVLTLQPGEYKLYTDIKIKTPSLITAVEKIPDVEIILFPNPTQTQLHVESNETVKSLQAKTITGSSIAPVRIDETTWDVSSLASGLYIVEVQTQSGISRKKIIKN